MRKEETGSVMNPKVYPILLAFMCMGFGDVAGPLAGIIKEDLQISNFMSQLLPFMGYIMFGILSIPLGIFQDKKGKKFILILGLTFALIGMIIPSIGLIGVDVKAIAADDTLMYFYMVLFAILLLGLGNTTLQVAGNPIMRDVSAQGKYSRNLSIGQFVKAIGTLSASLIPLAAARWFGMDWKLLFPVYTVILLLTFLLMLTLRVKERDREQKEETATFKSSFALLKNSYVLLMVLGIFFYVGIEIAMRSNLPIYLKEQFGINIQKEGIAGVLFFDIALLIGRFIGGVILSFIKPKTFFRISVIISLLGIAGIFLSSNSIGVGNSTLGFVSAFVAGLGFANIFPLIFSITIDQIPERSNELSGLMVTAIVGGAFIPPLMGFVADQTSILSGFWVPVVFLTYILLLALFNIKPAKPIKS